MATTRSARRAAPPPRDTDETPFAAILADLLARVPGAFAAALVDVLGETVDYTGRADPFDVKVAAAHWHIVLTELAALTWLGAPRTLVIRAAMKSFLVHTLSDEYAVVVLLGRRAGFGASKRALAVCERALAAEAGWTVRPAAQHCHAVNVECDRARRPARIRFQPSGPPTSLEVLGSVMGLAARERGYRVRLESGAELTLVRETGGFWYADENFSPANARSYRPAARSSPTAPARPPRTRRPPPQGTA